MPSVPTEITFAYSARASSQTGRGGEFDLITAPIMYYIQGQHMWCPDQGASRRHSRDVQKVMSRCGYVKVATCQSP